MWEDLSTWRVCACPRPPPPPPQRECCRHGKGCSRGRRLLGALTRRIRESCPWGHRGEGAAVLPGAMAHPHGVQPPAEITQHSRTFCTKTSDFGRTELKEKQGVVCSRPLQTAGCQGQITRPANPCRGECRTFYLHVLFLSDPESLPCRVHDKWRCGEKDSRDEHLL